jgi:hypothetical protein
MMVTPKVRKSRKKEKPMLYVAMHEVNLALCLAGGFLALRTEENASRDHHTVVGYVTFSKAPVSQETIKLAMGELKHGVVCLAEVEDKPRDNLGPVPISMVKRVIFATDEQASNFFTRMAGYGDIPEGVIEIAAAPNLFSKELYLDSPEIKNTVADKNALVNADKSRFSADKESSNHSTQDIANNDFAEKEIEGCKVSSTADLFPKDSKLDSAEIKNDVVDKNAAVGAAEQKTKEKGSLGSVLQGVVPKKTSRSRATNKAPSTESIVNYPEEVPTEKLKVKNPDDASSGIIIDAGAPLEITAEELREKNYRQAKYLNKLAGSVATTLAVYRNYPDESLAPLDFLFNIGSGQDWHDHPIELQLSKDIEAEPRSYNEELFNAVIPILENMNTRDGFDSISFLDELEGLVTKKGPPPSKLMQSFLSHSRSLMLAEIEHVADPYKDIPHLIIPRALLLFSLNPGWDRLSSRFAKNPDIGPKVRFFSAFFSGLYTGITTLSVTTKAPNKDVFLGISNLSYALFKKEPIKIETTEEWHPDGNGLRTYKFSGHTLNEMKLSTANIILDCYHKAREAKLSPVFDSKTGKLSLLITDYNSIHQVLVEQAIAPYFPREKSIRIVSRINREFTKTKIQQLIFPLIDSMHSSGIFFREKNANKGKKIILELYLYCPERLLSSSALDEMIKVVTQQNSEILKIS